MKLYEKIISIFLLVLGVSIIGVWTLLFFNGEATFTDDFNQVMEMGMHMLSELLLAVLALLTGIYLLYDSPKARKGLFFTIGLAAGSTFNACVFYFILEYNLLMAAVVGTFFILSTAVFISGLFRNLVEIGRYQVMYKSGLFLLGLLAYFLMNTAAHFAAPGSWHLFGQAVLFIPVILSYTAALVSHSGNTDIR